jgi:hypothetical protein
MAQQTAVESIIVDLDNECKARGMFVNWDMYLAMERQQIISAHLAGANDSDDIEGKTEIEYYNETYNK